MNNQDEMLKQVESIISEYKVLRGLSQDDELRGRPETEIIHFNTRARALIDRVCDRKSAYFKGSEKIYNYGGYPGYIAGQIIGIVRALHSDISSGYLRTQTELIHGELFSDFLEMAEHLITEGYKDAAAVIAGSSLESHLRQLAIKSEVELEYENNGQKSLKKSDRLNSELASKEIYSKLDQKSITSWLDLRNKAAHGKYSEYEAQQVSLMISGIRDFVLRVPA